MASKPKADPTLTRPTETITGFVAALLALLVAFGIEITEKQAIAILGLIGTTPGIVTYIVELRKARRAADST